jgi:hypothetical protein
MGTRTFSLRSLVTEWSFRSRGTGDRDSLGLGAYLVLGTWLTSSRVFLGSWLLALGSWLWAALAHWKPEAEAVELRATGRRKTEDGSPETAEAVRECGLGCGLQRRGGGTLLPAPCSLHPSQYTLHSAQFIVHSPSPGALSLEP